jgi:AcrR family transcriptional regulator
MRRETLRSQQAERVKTDILEAAMPLFARGYDAVSVKDIAAASGYKHSLVMYHFGTKDQLWEQTVLRLWRGFENLSQQYRERIPAGSTDRERMHRQLWSFILTLRDLPAYGQILLCEGVRPSDRLSWLYHNFIPSAFLAMRFDDKRLERALHTGTLLRSALSGAILYTVVAAPQVAINAELDGGELPSDLYPISDSLAQRLAEMMTEFLFSQLDDTAAH